MNAGFNVVASEVDEGFLKPAVFVSAYPSDVQPQCCGGALEEHCFGRIKIYIGS